MRSRIVVALLLIPVVVALTIADPPAVFAALVAVVAVMATAELFRMVRDYQPLAIVGLLAAFAMPFLALTAKEVGILLGVVAALPLTLAFLSVASEREDPIASLAVTGFSVAYIAVPAATLVLIRDSAHEYELIFLLLAGTWISDTGAYFGGRAFGRRKLAPKLSPNKTVEGLLCGVACGTVAVWYGHFLTSDVGGEPWLGGWEALAMGVAVSVAAPIGDLFESLIKRACGVKDSGALLGEHGGMLDRIDALLFSAPAMYGVAFAAGAL